MTTVAPVDVRPLVPALASLLIAVAAGACGGSDERVVVFAASSLADVLEEVEPAFEAAHPGVDVVVSVAGSSSLVAQLDDGAPADVLITADLATMDRARRTDAGVGEPSVVARNELVIAVERGNPLGVRALGDLARDDLVLVLAAPEVPAGAYAEQALACAGVRVDPSSLEQSVRAAAAKVSLGEADAALVYRTDIGDGLEWIELDAGCRVRAEYAIAAVGDGAVGRDVVAAMLGPIGRRALETQGFELP